jgi:hypothetical protein
MAIATINVHVQSPSAQRRDIDPQRIRTGLVQLASRFAEGAATKALSARVYVRPTQHGRALAVSDTEQRSRRSATSIAPASKRKRGGASGYPVLVGVRGLDRVQLRADLTILAKLSCPLSLARPVPLAA